MATASIGEDEKPAGRILLVEDNPSNLKLARIMVTKAGYHVDEACNGRDAVQTYTAAPDKYDLILMDVLMLEMDGLRATELIRAEGFDKVPIIAMTANAMKDDSERCLAAGMNDYITKPISRVQIFEIIEKWRRKKSNVSGCG